jgi:hypothetical protein
MREDTMKNLRSLFALSLLVCACNAEAGHPDDARRLTREGLQEGAAVASSQLSQRVEFPAFQLSADGSRFATGIVVRTDHLFEFDRVVGTDGVLAFGKHGVTLGVPNADAASVKAPPFRGSGAEHTSKVKDYFLGAGLPSSQLGEEHIHAAMQQGAALSEQLAGQAKPTFAGYTTVLYRQLDGIPVRGSYAWARFNAEDVVVAEEVFWPALPAFLVAEAQAFRARLTDPQQREAFLASVPAKHRALTPVVVVTHSPHFQDAFETAVVAEFPTTDDVRHFAADGKAFRFAHQLVADSATRR